MDFERLLNPEIKAFIQDNQAEDIRALALKKPPNPDWPYALIIDQIKARQKAKTKIPAWLSQGQNIIFPSSDILEQASSQATSNYKANLVSGAQMVDLTGGAGIDFFAFMQNFEHGTCVEKNKHAVEILAHNAPYLTQGKTKIHHGTAEDFIEEMPHVDFIYIDPQRRNQNRKSLFRLSDCTPDITALLAHLKKKSSLIMVKTSPMLDISQAIKDLQYVSAVHVVEWRGDCKEVLYIVDFNTLQNEGHIPHICVSLDDSGAPAKNFTFTRADEKQNAPISQPQNFLYEPGPAFQKSGGFNSLARHFKLNKLHTHTHLYTSKALNKNFPGRIFEIIDTLPVNRKALNLNKANLTIRNFPSDVAALQKKLKLKDGGTDYLFACTLHDEQKALIHCRKA